MLKKYVVSATYTEVKVWHVLAENEFAAIGVLADQDGSGKEVDVYIPSEPDYDAKEFQEAQANGLDANPVWCEERMMVQEHLSIGVNKEN
jgi:hypothetical protein